MRRLFPVSGSPRWMARKITSLLPFNEALSFRVSAPIEAESRPLLGPPVRKRCLSLNNAGGSRTSSGCQQIVPRQLGEFMGGSDPERSCPESATAFMSMKKFDITSTVKPRTTVSPPHLSATTGSGGVAWMHQSARDDRKPTLGFPHGD